ncbi:hypothetical protein GDO78_001885 [Eleutherodactylus coqui]|uniref:Uncharacterized protein n=1 Tax=Eleutherodactylus coqui TaxID=57060 RepID=A0A8J6FUP8_ELECQ|nr:hypothetical protein GDO78_001885 [Eleutherodactylus coqui]
MLSLQERRLRGDLIAVYKYLKGCHSAEGSALFSFVQGKTRSREKKNWKGGDTNQILEITLTVRLINEWNRLPQEVVISPSIKAFRGWTDICLG